MKTLYFLEKNRPGVGSDLKYKIHHLIFFEQLIVITFATLPTCLSWYSPLFTYFLQFLSLLFPYFVEITLNM